MPPCAPSRRRLLLPALVACATVALVSIPGGADAASSPATTTPRTTVPSAAASTAHGPDSALTPSVREVRVPGVDADAARTPRTGSLHEVVALSPVVPASGYAAVGATWAPGGSVAGQQLEVRTRTDGAWSGWQEMHADPEHAPTPSSAEADGALPGTDPVVVGAVDAVQVRATADGSTAPDGLTVSVVDPGRPDAAPRSAQRLGKPAYHATRGAGGVTGRPGIYSRAQWGADESMRNGFAGYGEIQAAFVHHTVNANSYTRREVPAILRGIYAYHTQSQGWSDVGYNFLVDRFGRVWEGRWGGISRPVIGAHTSGYNEDAFAMSAIGNFETAKPTKAMLRAYGRLFAWKLSLHGVNPRRSEVRIDGRTFHAVNGHRDAAATACPGRNLYERLGSIRRRAATVQDSWRSRRLQRAVVSGARPDLLVRSNKALRVLAGDPRPGFHEATRLPAGNWSSYRWAKIVGDWDGDGADDVLGVRDGRAWLHAGRGNGRFREPVGGWAGLRHRRIAAVGDWDGNGRPDLISRSSSGAAWVHPGRRLHGFGKAYRARSDIYSPTAMFGVGRWDVGGTPDLMTRTQDGSLLLWPGNGPGGLEDPVKIATGANRYDRLIGVGDLDRDRHPDLVGRLRSTGHLYLLPGRRHGLGTPVPVASGPQRGALG